MARFDTDFPDNLTQAELDALDKPTLEDFKLGFVYAVAEKLGQDVLSTTTDADGNQSYQPIYVLRDVVVREGTIITDLIDFMSALRAGTAYVSENDGTTTAPATTTVP